jgi:nitrate reductase NapE component
VSDGGFERFVFIAFALFAVLALGVHFCGGLWDTAPSVAR